MRIFDESNRDPDRHRPAPNGRYNATMSSELGGFYNTRGKFTDSARKALSGLWIYRTTIRRHVLQAATVMLREFILTFAARAWSLVRTRPIGIDRCRKMRNKMTLCVRRVGHADMFGRLFYFNVWVLSFLSPIWILIRHAHCCSRYVRLFLYLSRCRCLSRNICFAMPVWLRKYEPIMEWKLIQRLLTAIEANKILCSWRTCSVKLKFPLQSVTMLRNMLNKLEEMFRVAP